MWCGWTRDTVIIIIEKVAAIIVNGHGTGSISIMRLIPGRDFRAMLLQCPVTDYMNP